MMEKRNTEKPRLLSKFGDLSHAKVRSNQFKCIKGTKIFGEAEPADYIYQVVEGAVRSHKLLSDGRRQIGAFQGRFCKPTQSKPRELSCRTTGAAVR